MVSINSVKIKRKNVHFFLTLFLQIIDCKIFQIIT